MCPELTGSPVRGWSQVVVRVSSLRREKKKHLLHQTGKHGGPAAQLPVRETGRSGSLTLAHFTRLTWWRRPCRPRRRRRTSVPVRSPARAAPPWSGSESPYFMSSPLRAEPPGSAAIKARGPALRSGTRFKKRTTKKKPVHPGHRQKQTGVTLKKCEYLLLNEDYTCFYWFWVFHFALHFTVEGMARNTHIQKRFWLHIFPLLN